MTGRCVTLPAPENATFVNIMPETMSSIRDGPWNVQDFESPDAARCLMDDHARQAVQMDGAPVDMQYSHGSQVPHGGARGSSVSAGAHDWLCPMCQGINFFRCDTLKFVWEDDPF